MCTMWWSRRSRGCWCWFACSAVILLSVSNSSIFSSRSIAAKSIIQEKIILEGFVVYNEGGFSGLVFYIHKNIFLVHTSHISNFSHCLIFHRIIFISDLIWFELTKWIGPLKNFVQVFLLHLGKWSDVVAGLHSAHGNVIDDWERQNQETRSWKSSFRGKQKTNKTITL